MGAIGGHGKGQHGGKGRDEHLSALLVPQLPQQVHAEAADGAIDGTVILGAVLVCEIDGGGRQLTHIGFAAGEAGDGAAGQQDGAGQHNGKQTIHKEPPFLL